MNTPETQHDNPPAEEAPAIKPGRKMSGWIGFIAGFAGWYLIAGALFLLILISGNGQLDWGSSNYGLLMCGAIFFISNLMLLGLFAIIPETRRIALGMLTALASNFLFSTFAGTTFQASCFLPFFFK